MTLSHAGRSHRLPAPLAFALLGPLTGPLAYGAWRAWRAGRVVVAGVYGLGILEVVVGLPWVLVKIGGGL